MDWWAKIPKKILNYRKAPGRRLMEGRLKPKTGQHLERISQIIEENKP